MDNRKAQILDPHNIEFVFNKYFELFNSQCDLFKFFITQNGVLDWYGRTIRGNEKIHNFFRYHVCQEYDHVLFETASRCEPIETRSTHMESRLIPDESSTTLANSQRLTSSLRLPSSLADDRTSIQSISNEITPVSSRETPSIDRRDSLVSPIPAKRCKYDETVNQHHTAISLPNTEDIFGPECGYMVSPPDSSSIQQQPASVGTNGSSSYSELRYFETQGVLRACPNPVYKESPCSTQWDRETKIRVSYRIRLSDNDVQFALIIYQNARPYTSLSRRNLLPELNAVALEDAKHLPSGSSSKKDPCKSEEKRKIGRRLRL